MFYGMTTLKLNKMISLAHIPDVKLIPNLNDLDVRNECGKDGQREEQERDHSLPHLELISY